MQIIIAAIMPLMAVISPTQTYSEIYEQAVYECSRGTVAESRHEVVKGLVEIEREFFFAHPNVPESLRGFLLSAACRESRYNPFAKGDWRLRRGKKVAMAIGVLQLWPWWIKEYGVTRTDYVVSAKIWLDRIAYQYKKNKRYKRCQRLSDKRQWIAAWVQTTRGAPVNKENNYRCKQVPTHYKILKKWIRNIKQDREEVEDGC